MRVSNDEMLLADHFHESDNDEQGIDYLGILRILWAYKWSIAAVAAVTYFIAAIYISTLVPIYHTSALLKIEQKSQGVIGVENVSSVLGQRYQSSAEMALIKSQRVLNAAVDELNLEYTITPRYFPYIGATLARRHQPGKGLAEPLLGLGKYIPGSELEKYAWGGETLRLDRFEISGKLGDGSTQWKLIAGENQEYDLLSGNGDLVLSGKVGESASAEYQDSTIEVYISQLLARPGLWFFISRPSTLQNFKSLKGRLFVSVEKGDGYLDNGIIKLSVEGENPYKITDIVNVVADTYVKKNIEDQAQEAQQVLDFVQQQLPTLKGELDKAQRSLQKFRQRIQTVDLEFETQSALTQLKEFENELSELELKKDDLQQRFTDSHSEVTVITRQIKRIQEKQKAIEEQLHILPEREWEFIQKTRDVELATQLYVVLLNKAQELKVAKAGMIGNVRIIDPAVLDMSPIKPNRSKMRFQWLLIGLLLGLLQVYIRRLMHNRVVDPNKIEKETGLHVYANIPHSPAEIEIHSMRSKGKKHKQGGAGLLAFEKNADLAVEALRSFRTSMRFTMKTSENNVIIIGGPSASIGKSFFSANYAAVASKEGQRVLLIDGDMRKGYLHHYMGKDKKPGLSEIIAQEVSLEEALHEIADNLYFISSGERPPNPAELLGSDGFQEMLKHAQKVFDLVIIDTPPILAVTDASVIAQYGGQLFLLLRYDRHHVREVQAAISLFEKNGVNVAGLLLNDVDMSGHGYGYGYGYGGYRYEYK